MTLIQTDNVWRNQYSKNAFNAIKQQYKKYATGCIQEKSTLPTADSLMVKALYPELEDLLLNDILEGGKHDFSKVEQTHIESLCGERFMFVNCKMLPRVQKLEDILRDSSGIPLNGRYDMVQEGNKFIDMIRDFHQMDVREFSEKYPVPQVDITGFVRNQVEKKPKLEEVFYNYEYAEGMMICDDTAPIALYKFVKEHDDQLTDEYLRKIRANGSSVSFSDKYPIDKLGVYFKASCEDISKGFQVTEVTFMGYTGEEARTISVTTNLDVDTTGLGKYFTEKYPDFAERYTPIFKYTCSADREKMNKAQKGYNHE